MRLQACVPSRQRAFTLVELLVVIGIISVLIAMLLPALNKARQQAKVVACGSQERQICLALLMYAQDNKGWLPRVRWATPEMLEDETTGGYLNPASIKPYIKSAAILNCPGEAQATHDAYFGRYGNPSYYMGSYWIIGGHGDWTDSATGQLKGWFGWHFYVNSGYAPIPRVGWAGRTVTDPSTISTTVRTQYIHPADSQPMVTDCFDPTDRIWNGYGVSNLPNNHFGMHGENVAFADGHVEWRQAKLDADGKVAADSQVQPRCELYQWVYW